MDENKVWFGSLVKVRFETYLNVGNFSTTRCGIPIRIEAIVYVFEQSAGEDMLQGIIVEPTDDYWKHIFLGELVRFSRSQIVETLN